MLFKYDNNSPLRLYNVSHFIDNNIYDVIFNILIMFLACQ